MSYVGSQNPPQPRRPRRRPLTVAVAALVPGALLGWVVYDAVGEGGTDQASAQTPAASTSAPPTAPPTASSTSDDEKPSPAPSGPLKGKVVVIDPGHNPANFQHTAEINRKVNIGTNWKGCDTTGTSTNSGYTEAKFTLDVAHRLRTLLQQQGATVKLTQDGDRPYGPCIDERAKIGNKAEADAVVSIHADGSGAGNRGFHVILPAKVKAGTADTGPIIAPSRDLGERIAGNFARATGTAPSNYVGDGTGLVTRKDLGGLNLSTVPKVFIECGNMRDSEDVALLTSGAWRQKAARGISEGLVSFLEA
ncbi:N-acetylmuramoyl-L-alanine amidase [Streptomyces dysideae]|uniref:N-acetylmuramoyl-L-alanine amidase n=1 Tax=Streptomyces dysideae TaxID=909626 RepID=A0A101V4Q1_9ACTN|nr:N-acetylmuramoyl-L-alanine amidase [Streptomyces dysideae]KUO22479.1 N-acetylmuramoyl-L-alanine amidase [Streptomyces dysideae]